MRQAMLLAALTAIVAVGLCGCDNTTTGFSGMEVALSGQYQVLSKDPGILPGFTSMQLFQNGKSLEAIDNLGRTWTGTLSNLTLYGVTTTAAEEQQQTTTTQQQQQQTTEPESYHAEIYLETHTSAGKITMSGAIETSAAVSIPSTDQTQQATTTSSNRTTIAVAVMDEKGNAGSVFLYNIYAPATTTTQP
jgi:hypothetical protein